jgi:hypothetical protein
VDFRDLTVFDLRWFGDQVYGHHHKHGNEDYRLPRDAIVGLRNGRLAMDFRVPTRREFTNEQITTAGELTRCQLPGIRLIVACYDQSFGSPTRRRERCLDVLANSGWNRGAASRLLFVAIILAPRG